ncbi:MAG TPA: hypothetical protein VFO52_00400 [Longimicrobiales bacterium]|nr:hypothetical protein [Longimicrobiales bacterium]
MRNTLRLLALQLLVFTSTLTGQSGAPSATCSVAVSSRPLSTDVRETSGLVRGRTAGTVLWTHNDSANPPVLFAIGADGSVKARIPVEQVRFHDWEDIEAGSCGNANCLYLADIGDNAGQRSHVTIYEVVEPALSARNVRPTRTITARYSDGPQDAEAMFRLSSGELYIVTKGRQKSIKLYRLTAGGAGGQGTFQLVRELASQPRSQLDRVTAASASPDGKWVAIRSYAKLFLYATTELLNNGAPALTYSLAPLKEKQGESVALDNDGTVWLTSEAERKRDTPTIASLKCSLP